MRENIYRERWVKRWLKNVVSIILGVMVAVLINGGIAYGNEVPEKEKTQEEQIAELKQEIENLKMQFGDPGVLSTESGVRAMRTLRASATGEEVHFLSLKGDSGAANYNNDGATGQNSIAIGVGALADKTKTIAIGNLVKAKADNSIAIGLESEAKGKDGIVMGRESSSDADSSIAIGSELHTKGESTIMIGNKISNSKDDKKKYTNLGLDINVEDWNVHSYVVDLGRSARVGSLRAGTSTDGGQRNIVIGNGVDLFNPVGTSNITANSTSTDAIVIGNNAAPEKDGFPGGVTVGNESIVIGRLKSSFREQSIAIGNDAKSDRGIALGNKAYALKADGLALGNDTQVENINSVALGWASKAGKITGSNEGTTVGYLLYGRSDRNNDLINGVVSVGNPDYKTKDGWGEKYPLYRRVVNVAGGVDDHDVVIVKQLKRAQPHFLAVNGLDEFDDTDNYASNMATGKSGIAIGVEVATDGDSAVAIGNNTKGFEANKTIAIGADNKVSYSENSAVIGNNIHLTGVEDTHASGNLMAGFNDKFNIGTNSLFKENGQKEIDGEQLKMYHYINDDSLPSILVGKNGNYYLENSLNNAKYKGEEYYDGNAIGSAVYIEDGLYLFEENSFKEFKSDGWTYEIGGEEVDKKDPRIDKVRRYKTGYYNVSGTAPVAIPAIADISGNTKISAKDIVALGNNIVAQTDNSVYLGADSSDGYINNQANKDAGHKTTTAGMSVYRSATIDDTEYENFAGAEPKGIVSVGAPGKERRIENVAAGLVSEDSTDAVNGSQLYSVIKSSGGTDGVHFVSITGDTTEDNYNNDGATGTHGIAIGVAALSNGESGTAIGNKARGTEKSVAIGPNASTHQEEKWDDVGGGAKLKIKDAYDSKSSVAIGDSSNAKGDKAIAIGENAVAGIYKKLESLSGTKEIQRPGIAIGAGAYAGGSDVRQDITGDGTYISSGIAIGTNAKVGLYGNGIAFGDEASVQDSGSLAIGTKAKVIPTELFNSNNSIALGTEANVTGTNSIAIGTAAIIKNKLAKEIPQTNAVALGFSSKVERHGSVALGAWSETRRVSLPGLDESRYATNGSYGTDKIIAPFSNAELKFYDIMDNAKYNDTQNTDKFKRLAVNGVVSVGGVYDKTAGAGTVSFGRQIINLADGTEDTDAVNLRQLKGAASYFVSTTGKENDPNYHNDGAKGKNSIAIGVGASIDNNSEAAVAIGENNQGISVKNTTVIGSDNFVSNVDNSAIIGNNIKVIGTKSTKATGNVISGFYKDFDISSSDYFIADGQKEVAGEQLSKYYYINNPSEVFVKGKNGKYYNEADLNKNYVYEGGEYYDNLFVKNYKYIEEGKYYFDDHKFKKVEHDSSGYKIDGEPVQDNDWRLNRAKDYAAGFYKVTGYTPKPVEITPIASASGNIKSGIKDTVALGNNIIAHTDNSVYLGADSSDGHIDNQANKDAGHKVTTAGMGTYGSVTVGETQYGNFAGAEPKGIVSVGAPGKERRIENVAAGLVSEDSTDAINGSQLYSIIKNTQTKLENAGGELKYAGDSYDEDLTAADSKINLKTETLTIAGGTDSNISTVAKANGTIALNLKDTINVGGTNKVTIGGENGTVKTGDVAINRDGITVGNDVATPENNITINTQGISAGNKVIKNVAAGKIEAGSTDAVNGGQLAAFKTDITTNTNLSYGGNKYATGVTATDAKLNLSSGTLKIVGETEDEAKSNIVTTAKGNGEIAVDLNDSIKVGKAGNKVEIDGTTGSVKTGDVTISKDEITVGNGNKITINGNNGTITNLTNKTWNPGTIVSGRAATEDQLKEVVTTLSASGGGKVVIKGTGAVVATPVTDEAGHKGYNIHVDRIVQYVDSEGRDVIKDGDNFYLINNGQIDRTKKIAQSDVSVRMVNPDGSTSTPTRLGNVAAGRVAPDSTDAVNGSQLHATNQQVADNTRRIDENAREIHDLRRDHNNGMAQMSAMAAVDFVHVNPNKMKVGAGVGGYKGARAVAVGVAYAPTEHFLINAKWSTPTTTHRGSAFGIGATYEFNCD